MRPPDSGGQTSSAIWVNRDRLSRRLVPLWRLWSALPSPLSWNAIDYWQLGRPISEVHGAVRISPSTGYRAEVSGKLIVSAMLSRNSPGCLGQGPVMCSPGTSLTCKWRCVTVCVGWGPAVPWEHWPHWCIHDMVSYDLCMLGRGYLQELGGDVGPITCTRIYRYNITITTSFIGEWS